MPRWVLCILCVSLVAGCAGPAADLSEKPPAPARPAARKADAKAARADAGDGWGEDLLAAPGEKKAPPKTPGNRGAAEEEEDWEQELRPEQPPAPQPVRPAREPPPTGTARAAGAQTRRPDSAEKGKEQATEGGAEPVLGVWAGGGVQVLRGSRVQPSASVALDVRLSRWIGWKGFFAAARLDSVFGSTPLGSGYVMWDVLVSGGGRFGTGLVRVSPELGFGARFLTITSHAGGATEEPRAGFGFMAALGVEFLLARFCFLGIKAGGRYLQDPLSRGFGLSGAFDAGVWFVF
ncbi:MAG: hypothetical protein GYA21_13910 [Myxococcales bacterium]|nr:hypothetical protein [Myxococcales bacterium]